MKDPISSILEKYSSTNKGNLISILQDVQKAEGFISAEAVNNVSAYLNMSRSRIFGVASFYSQFNFNPPGRHSIRICLGTACHVQGGDFLLNALNMEIDVEPGETTADGRFDLERVACLGCCALAPVLMINNKIYSRVTVVKLKEIISEYE